MLHRVRSRLTYANVMSTVGVFIALGGTSYAALTLPRNSVGSSQIRAKAVGGSELRSRAVTSRVIRDGSVTLREISSSARSQLRGQTGPPGPAGPSGIAYTAAVNATGNKVRGNASFSQQAAGSNETAVTFPSDVSQCVSTATLAKVEGTDPEDPPAGRITVARGGGATVLVRTFNEAGAPVGLPFHLIVAC